MVSARAKVPSHNSSDCRAKRNSSQKFRKKIEKIEYRRTDQATDHASQQVNGRLIRVDQSNGNPGAHEKAYNRQDDSEETIADDAFDISHQPQDSYTHTQAT